MQKSSLLALTLLLICGAYTLAAGLIIPLIGPITDAFFLMHGNPLPSAPGEKIMIVRIDNASLDELQKWDLKILTLQKSLMADLLGKVEKGGGRAIAFDIVFANDGPDAGVFMDAIEASKIPVILGVKWGVGDSEQILPLSIYSGATWWLVDSISDGSILTKYPVGYSISGRWVETLAVALYRSLLKLPSPESAPRGNELTIGPRTLTIEAGWSLRIPFFRLPWNLSQTVRAEYPGLRFGYPSVGLSETLKPDFDVSVFADKIILVGEYGTLIHDAHTSSVFVSSDMPWVEFHANFLEGLLIGKTLVKENIPLLIYALLLISVAVAIFFSSRWSLLYVLLTPIVITGIGQYLVRTGIVIPWLALMLSTIVGYIGGNLWRYFVTDREKRFISSAFAHYLAPELVSQIARDPKSLHLGGEKRDVVVFFSDLVGFTTLSERLGTDKLFTLMSQYLSEMTDILVAHNGTLDKYIGDAVMGFFGAPAPLENSEVWACRSAIRQLERLRQLASEWERQGLPHVSVRIGLHCGQAMVGNVWSKTRFNYTAMGDTVNLASRLEGANKPYGSSICVSDDLRHRIRGNEFLFRELDTVRVKGKHEPTTLYELVGFSAESDKKESVSTYEKALSLYKNGEFPAAQTLWKTIAATDIPSATMAERCEEIISGEIELGIDRVWTLVEK